MGSTFKKMIPTDMTKCVPTSRCAETIDLEPSSIKGFKFSQIVAGPYYVCGLMTPDATVRCWGHSAWLTASVWPTPGKKFKKIMSVSDFVQNSDGEKGRGTGGFFCSDGKNTDIGKESQGSKGIMCGVTKAGRISCWGPGNPNPNSNPPNPLDLISKYIITYKSTSSNA